jgi:hypothetical protein
MLPRLPRKHPQQMQCIRLVGLLRQHLPVDALRLGQISRPVLLHAQIDCFLYGHCHPSKIAQRRGGLLHGDVPLP